MKNSVLKAAITVILFLFIVLVANPERILLLIGNVDLRMFALSLLAVPLGICVRAVKWRIILKDAGIGIGFFESLRAVFIGIFYSLFTPAKSGELARAYYISGRKSRIIPTIIYDRVTDIISLIVVAFILLFAFLGSGFLWLLAAFTACFFASLIAFLKLNERVMNVFERVFGIDEDSRTTFSRVIAGLFSNRRLASKSIMLSLLFYTIIFSFAVPILLSLDAGLNPLLVSAMPLAILIGNIPVTISGIGMREFVTAFYFEKFGYSFSLGFSFSLLCFVVLTLIPGVVGYAFSVFGGYRVRK